MSPALVLLLAATALHAGFQVTVTTLVYPVLVRTAPESFRAAHERHSRTIVPLVGVVYGVALMACTVALTSGQRSLLALDGVGVAVAATLTAFGLTALVASPTHGALGRGPQERLFRRLLRADRARSALAVLALGGAVVAAVTG